MLKLKQLGLIHADLKPENIMLVDPSRQPYRYLCYFVFCFVISKKMKEKKNANTNRCSAQRLVGNITFIIHIYVLMYTYTWSCCIKHSLFSYNKTELMAFVACNLFYSTFSIKFSVCSNISSQLLDILWRKKKPIQTHRNTFFFSSLPEIRDVNAAYQIV